LKLTQYIDSVKNKKIEVLGAGVSNLPLIRRLAESGCDVTVRDKAGRERLGETAEELSALGVRLVLGDGYLENITGDVLFRTPGLHPDTPAIAAARARGCEITSEMEVFFRVCPCRILAVTGSDGKTTTTTIISELLKAAGYTVHVGGNIGRPLLCEADDMRPEDIAVLELSSFQLMTMTASPQIAVVTNLAPNHLDVHKDMAEYMAAKKNIFVHQGPEDLLVLNADNAVTAGFIPEAKGRLRTFSRQDKVASGFWSDGEAVYSSRLGRIMATSEIRLPGLHNVENYLAAFAATEDLVSAEVMRQVAQTFGGVEHRIEFVRELRGVKYYNDSIASSPSRTIAGLRSFAQRVILIAGGKDKGVPFDELGTEILEHVKTLVVTGWTADKIRAAVENAPGYAGEPGILQREGFRDAVLAASGAAQPGDVVLLSPACTSFDRFRNFAERGNFFKEIVNGLQ